MVIFYWGLIGYDSIVIYELSYHLIGMPREDGYPWILSFSSWILNKSFGDDSTPSHDSLYLQKRAKIR